MSYSKFRCLKKLSFLVYFIVRSSSELSLEYVGNVMSESDADMLIDFNSESYFFTGPKKKLDETRIQHYLIFGGWLDFTQNLVISSSSVRANSLMMRNSYNDYKKLSQGFWSFVIFTIQFELYENSDINEDIGCSAVMTNINDSSPPSYVKFIKNTNYSVECICGTPPGCKFISYVRNGISYFSVASEYY